MATNKKDNYSLEYCYLAAAALAQWHAEDAATREDWDAVRFWGREIKSIYRKEYK